MLNPEPIIRVEDLVDDPDPHLVEESRDIADKAAVKIPRRYRSAIITQPEVAEWVRDVVTNAVREQRGPCIAVESGPSLTLLGPTGTGKTFEAYGAINALGFSGVRVRWQMSTAADIYARMRPRHGVDSEEEFEKFAHAPLLVIDDLGAAKSSEWVEEVNYRLINHRYENVMPTLITSNVPVEQLKEQMGERVAGRLREMSQAAMLQGPDRRAA